MDNTRGETVQEVLERHYVSRAISCLKARKNTRKAREKGDTAKAAEFSARADQHNSACAEVRKIASDLGIALDTYALIERAKEFEREVQETLRVFEAARPEDPVVSEKSQMAERPCPCGRMTINDCAGECGVPEREFTKTR